MPCDRLQPTPSVMILQSGIIYHLYIWYTLKSSFFQPEIFCSFEPGELVAMLHLRLSHYSRTRSTWESRAGFEAPIAYLVFSLLTDLQTRFLTSFDQTDWRKCFSICKNSNLSTTCHSNAADMKVEKFSTSKLLDTSYIRVITDCQGNRTLLKDQILAGQILVILATVRK